MRRCTLLVLVLLTGARRAGAVAAPQPVDIVTYGERWNDVQKEARHHGHYFKEPVDPYVVPGDPSSGLLARIGPEPPGDEGQGDHRIQAYCFRMCLTTVPDNRVPFPGPAGYDPAQYELLLRVQPPGRPGIRRAACVIARESENLPEFSQLPKKRALPEPCVDAIISEQHYRKVRTRVSTWA